MDKINFQNFTINNGPIDEILHKKYPDEFIKHLVFSLDIVDENPDKRSEIIRNIAPEVNENLICPILVEDDDWKLEEGFIVVLIENSGKTVNWKYFGKMDLSYKENSLKLENILWFNDSPNFTFNTSEYFESLKYYLEI